MGRSKESWDKMAEYNKGYIKDNIKAYSLKLNKNTDSDMIVHLDSKEKYSVYIKQLIADDMKK